MRSAIALKHHDASHGAYAEALISQVEAWRQRRQQRRRTIQLRSLNDHTLKDIGVPRCGIMSIVAAQTDVRR